jgi:tRNA-dihydrouridine synthase
MLTSELDIPITGKIRLGWDDENLNYLEVAKAVEDNGGCLIAVHGRTRQQAYRGEANWRAIAEIKAQANIPVIGNGDVRTVADIQRMLEFTGCDAVMIGRGAIGNPWIFAGLDRNEVSLDEVRQTMLQHLDSMLQFYGADRGLVLFRKHASRYISPFGLSNEQREQLLRCEKPEEFISLLDLIATSEKSISAFAFN